jgi:hypothetical protein
MSEKIPRMLHHRWTRFKIKSTEAVAGTIIKAKPEAKLWGIFRCPMDGQHQAARFTPQACLDVEGVCATVGE